MLVIEGRKEAYQGYAYTSASINTLGRFELLYGRVELRAKLATGNGSWPFDKPQYLLINLAIGGSWGGQKGIQDTLFPKRYLVDYVRVYQQK